MEESKIDDIFEDDFEVDFEDGFNDEDSTEDDNIFEDGYSEDGLFDDEYSEEEDTVEDGYSIESDDSYSENEDAYSDKEGYDGEEGVYSENGDRNSNSNTDEMSEEDIDTEIARLSEEIEEIEGATDTYDNDTDKIESNSDINDNDIGSLSEEDIDAEIERLNQEIAEEEEIGVSSSSFSYRDDTNEGVERIEDLDGNSTDTDIDGSDEEYDTEELDSSHEDGVIDELDSSDENSEDADEYGTFISMDVMNNREEYNADDEYKDTGFLDNNGNIVVADIEDNGNKFELRYISLENIIVYERIRLDKNTEPMVQSVKQTGLLYPVVVALTATEGYYALVDGYRRVLACAKSGIKQVPAIINKSINTTELPILEAMYNQKQSYSMKEIVKYIKYMEEEKGIMSATMIEYLMQLNSGDYVKLKDILEDDDDDIVSKLMEGQFTIEQAFKALEKRRKQESKTEKEIKQADKVFSDTEESGVNMVEAAGELGDDSQALTDDEIDNLALNASDLDDEVESEDIEELAQDGEIEGYEANQQDPNNRTILDPKIRKSVLARDENTCQICKVVSGMEYTEVLDVHHIVEVYLGGKDNIENLITACTCCHKLIHLYGRGELYMRPFDEMEEDERNKFKRIIKLGNVIRKGVAAKHMKKEELKKLDKAETIGRTKPGTERQIAG